MKATLLLLIAVLTTLSLSAQELQKDSTTSKYIYRVIVPVDSADAGTLFDRAMQWIPTGYRDAKAVIQYEDKAVGKIILKGFWINKADAYQHEEHHTLTMEFKDGRARITFSDLYEKGISPLPDTPVESKGMFAKQNRAYFARILSSMAEDIKKALAKSATTDKW